MGIILPALLFFALTMATYKCDYGDYRMCYSCQCYYSRILKCTGKHIVTMPPDLYNYFKPLVIELSYTGIRCASDIDKYEELELIKLEVMYACINTISVKLMNFKKKLK